jgi:hypothetical protein
MMGNARSSGCSGNKKMGNARSSGCNGNKKKMAKSLS